MSYKVQFIDSAKFMASSLSNLIKNLAEGTHKTRCKHGDDTCRNKYKDCDGYLEHKSLKDDRIECKYLCC